VRALAPVQSCLDATAVSGKLEADTKQGVVVGNEQPADGPVNITDEASAKHAFFNDDGSERKRATQAMLALADPMDDSKPAVTVALIPLFAGETAEEYEAWVDKVHRIMDDAGVRYIGSAGDGAAVTESLYQKRCRVTPENPKLPDHYIGFDFDDGSTMVYGELIKSKVRMVGRGGSWRRGWGASIPSVHPLINLFVRSSVAFVPSVTFVPSRTFRRVRSVAYVP